MLPIAYTTPLEPGEFYHIFNSGNNRQTVFLTENDYALFLEKWDKYITPIAKTFAYNLLPNQFHAMIQIRDSPLDIDPSRLNSKTTRAGTPVWVSRAFKNFFISFARCMQIRHGFHGALFHSPFKRRIINQMNAFNP